MVGRTECLGVAGAIDHWKAHGLDFSELLHSPTVPESVGRFCQVEQDHGLAESLDQTVLIDRCRPAIDYREKVEINLPIRNINRAVGTAVGSEVTLRYGSAGLPEDTIRLNFSGSAGQSFGAFVPRGMTLTLSGDVNDYLGKGLSGGKLIVYPPPESQFTAAENVIIGNVALYGATSGAAFISGLAGERFAVRNSGAVAVVEGVGDHGCEYMTGGRVIVIGSTGRNFAAGMSGGIAYVLDGEANFHRNCNTRTVDLTRIEDEPEIELVKNLIFQHAEYTRSARATEILLGWEEYLPTFVRVIPHDYRRVLEAQQQMQMTGLSSEEAAMAAFESNTLQMVRVAGT
jgi:glutamate synthase (ferredoxin)